MLDEAWVPRQDVTAIAVGVGPGPFTGLRVGLVTARTLGAVLEIPVYGVCTLDVLAAEAVDAGAVDGPFLVATDARRKEVYWASYDAARRPPRRARTSPARPTWRPTCRSWAAAPCSTPTPSRTRSAPSTPTRASSPAVVTDERAELLDPEPLYLRRPDAAAPGKPKRVS